MICCVVTAEMKMLSLSCATFYFAHSVFASLRQRGKLLDDILEEKRSIGLSIIINDAETKHTLLITQYLK